MNIANSGYEYDDSSAIHRVFTNEYDDYLFVDDIDLAVATQAGEIVVDDNGDYVFTSRGAFITASHALD
jgi:hypothetical protein